MKIRITACLACLTLFASGDSASNHMNQIKLMFLDRAGARHPEAKQYMANKITEYAASNNISDEVVSNILIDMIKTSLEARASGKNIREFPRGTITYEDSMLGYLSNYRTTNAMQFLKSMCFSTNKFVRHAALKGYIRSAKLEALPTLKKCVQSGQLSESDTYTSYKYFAYEIGQAEAGKQDSKKIEEAKAFLLERAQEEKRRSAANELDKILCGMFPDYATSVQREKVATHFMNDDNEICRRQFMKIHEDIQKAPKEKRKDFSGKGELLDPEREKNKPDAQP